MKKVVISKGKKYIVNIPDWDDAGFCDSAGSGSLPSSPPVYLPFFSLQPESVTTGSGATVILSAAAGPLGPFDQMSYQWYSGSSAALTNGGQYTGSDTPLLTITNTDSSNNGTYWIYVVNAYGNLTSSNVTITIS